MMILTFIDMTDISNSIHYMPRVLKSKPADMWDYRREKQCERWEVGKDKRLRMTESGGSRGCFTFDLGVIWVRKTHAEKAIV